MCRECFAHPRSEGAGMHRPRWLVAFLPLVLIAAAASFAAPGEPDHPQPPWSDTGDTDAGGHERSSGVDGNVVVGMPGSLRADVLAIAVKAPPHAHDDA